MQHPSIIVLSTESGILNEAMEDGFIDSSEPGSIDMTSSHEQKPAKASDGSSGLIEPPSKRAKTKSVDRTTTSARNFDVWVDRFKDAKSDTLEPKADSQAPPVDDEHRPDGKVGAKTENSESSVVTTSCNASTSESNVSLLVTQTKASVPEHTPVPNPPVKAQLSQSLDARKPDPASKLPSKSTKMIHLRENYLGELEYMLREFRRLERQLLGAKGAAQLEESAGSRERREKLHHFILHLEDTVHQLETGCTTNGEDLHGSGEDGAARENSSGGTGDAPSKKLIEDEENVQKLEEHILANLLPVKIRLKKQLAAQQGATKNPPGMPAPRRGSILPSSAALGKGTFAAAAEERRRQAEEERVAQEELAMRRVSDPTQFGKPLGGGGSSLTQKLHGATLGSRQRVHGHGVGSSSAPKADRDDVPPERHILYAGMTPKSKQHQSSLDAASGVHDLVVESPNVKEKTPDKREPDVGSHESAQPSATPSAPVESKPHLKNDVKASNSDRKEPSSTVPALTAETAERPEKLHEDAPISEEERRKLRKRRRKKKLQRIAKLREKERQRQVALQQQAQAAQGSAKACAGRKRPAAIKSQGKKKGPKSVEYMCALCSETYASTCDCNPWWSLSQHECPKCRKTQIPRIDISAPANAIDYHPALLAHAEENGGAGAGSPGAAANINVVHVAQPDPTYEAPPKEHLSLEEMEADSDSDLSELSDCSLSDGSLGSDEASLDFQSMTQPERAEHEEFGQEYDGPILSEEEAARLLVLMAHASTCPCRHKLTKHRDVCRSTKYMMLHVRDCPGTTACFDVCPFPWCRKVKHLLYHLVSCVEPETCEICSPTDLSDSLKGLSSLNARRLKKHRERLVSAMKAENTSRPKVGYVGNSRSSTHKALHRKASEIAKATASKAKSHFSKAKEAVSRPTQRETIPPSSKGFSAAMPAKPVDEAAESTAQAHTAPTVPQCGISNTPKAAYPATSCSSTTAALAVSGSGALSTPAKNSSAKLTEAPAESRTTCLSATTIAPSDASNSLDRVAHDKQSSTAVSSSKVSAVGQPVSARKTVTLKDYASAAESAPAVTGTPDVTATAAPQSCDNSPPNESAKSGESTRKTTENNFTATSRYISAPKQKDEAKAEQVGPAAVDAQEQAAIAEAKQSAVEMMLEMGERKKPMPSKNTSVPLHEERRPTLAQDSHVIIKKESTTKMEENTTQGTPQQVKESRSADDDAANSVTATEVDKSRPQMALKVAKEDKVVATEAAPESNSSNTACSSSKSSRSPTGDAAQEVGKMEHETEKKESGSEISRTSQPCSCPLGEAKRCQAEQEVAECAPMEVEAIGDSNGKLKIEGADELMDEPAEVQASAVKISC